jgi:hypothetical protein
MSTFGKVTAKSTEAELNVIVEAAQTAVNDGFTPNPFACKLPLNSDGIKGVITEKEWRKWEKNGNKGLILSITANFETANGGVIDKVTTTNFEEWKSFALGGTITVTVENKATKAEKFAKIKTTAVTVE